MKAIQKPSVKSRAHGTWPELALTGNIQKFDFPCLSDFAYNL